jgi:hypothetical protein
MISVTLTAVGVEKTTKTPSSGALVVEHSIPFPKRPPLVYKGAWELSVSLLPVTDFWVNPRAFICCLRMRSPISLRSPHRPLTKGGGRPKRISKGERPVHLSGLDLILSKANGSNWSHCGWVSWHSFPNCNFRILFIHSTLPKLWGH